MMSGYHVISMTTPPSGAQFTGYRLMGLVGTPAPVCHRNLAAHHWTPAGAVVFVAAAASGGRRGARHERRHPATSQSECKCRIFVQNGCAEGGCSGSVHAGGCA